MAMLDYGRRLHVAQVNFDSFRFPTQVPFKSQVARFDSPFPLNIDSSSVCYTRYSLICTHLKTEWLGFGQVDSIPT